MMEDKVNDRFKIDPSWIQEGDSPPVNARVELMVLDHVGTYRFPFPVLATDEWWINESTGEELADELDVIAWRPWKK